MDKPANDSPKRRNGSRVDKNGLAKYYGGDVTQKRKLLEKQGFMRAVLARIRLPAAGGTMPAAYAVAGHL